MRFAIRDLLWLTLLAAVVVAWWVDRSKLAWQYEQSIAAMERLRGDLDVADPKWRTTNEAVAIPTRFDKQPWPEVSYVFAALLFGIVALVLVLVWQGRLHWSILGPIRR